MSSGWTSGSTTHLSVCRIAGGRTTAPIPEAKSSRTTLMVCVCLWRTCFLWNPLQVMSSGPSYLRKIWVFTRARSWKLFLSRVAWAVYRVQYEVELTFIFYKNCKDNLQFQSPNWKSFSRFLWYTKVSCKMKWVENITIFNCYMFLIHLIHVTWLIHLIHPWLKKQDVN